MPEPRVLPAQKATPAPLGRSGHLVRRARPGPRVLPEQKVILEQQEQTERLGLPVQKVTPELLGRKAQLVPLVPSGHRVRRAPPEQSDLLALLGQRGKKVMLVQREQLERWVPKAPLALTEPLVLPERLGLPEPLGHKARLGRLGRLAPVRPWLRPPPIRSHCPLPELPAACCMSATSELVHSRSTAHQANR